MNHRLHRRFLSLAAVTVLIALGSRPSMAQQTDAADRPNFLIIFTDDQGYGDLSCYGATDFQTPRIDRLAEEGTKFTSFYAQVTCGPSRSALLTGRYPIRSHGWSMPATEITMAELFQQAGYATGCIGKWDVSNRRAIPDRMPHSQGFDYYYGTLGANDGAHVVFHENDKRVGETRDMASLTKLYTDKAIDFLQEKTDEPFFLYLAHTMVHSVIDASDEFKGKSKGGLYGDTMEELDFHTGRLLDTVDELGLRDNTIVIFTSDNGPWSNAAEALRKLHNGAVAWGDSGPLRAAKGSTYEGGIRVPCIARWPDHIPAGRTSDALFATIDFLPTFGRLAGFSPPADRTIDGIDQTDLLLGRSETGARSDFYYFSLGELQGVRRGRWKLILPNLETFYPFVKDRPSGNYELYDLKSDVGEQTDLAAAHPELVEELKSYAHALPLPEEKYWPGIGIPQKRAEPKNAK